MADIVFPSRELRGRKRFPTNAEFLKTIRSRVETTAQRMLDNLPSNYPRTDKGEIGALYKAFANEIELLNKATSDVREDSVHQNTRPEFLFQVLGDLLFLGDKAIGPLDSNGDATLSDVEYREFLLKVRNGYFGGSRTANIESTLSDILGIPVVIKELYKEARKVNSVYGLKDTHKLIFDIFMDDDSAPTTAVGQLLQDLLFFIDLIKPAHKLFDTRLIWQDALTINSCLTDVFAASDEGVLISYDYTPSTETVYSLTKMSLYVGDTDSSVIVGDTWLSGTVAAINNSNNTVTLTNGNVLVISSISLFYDQDVDGDFRIDLDDVIVGDPVKYLGLLAPGTFQFYKTPEDVMNNAYLQYDPLYIQTPIFQENVIKVYDDNGRFEVATAQCDTTIIERKVTDILLTEYEDLRDSCCYPSPKPISATFSSVALTPIANTNGVYNMPAYLNPTDDPNTYTASVIPMLNSEGNLAVLADLEFLIDGLRVADSIVSVNSLTGVIVLNFVPPANVVVRVDYYTSDRFPSIERFDTTIVCGSTPPAPGDLVACVTPVPADAVIKRIKWPFEVVNLALHGDELDYQMDTFPVLDQLGNLAEIDDVVIYVDGVVVADSVTSIRPLLGHVRINFLPPSGSTLRFEYYSTTKCKTFALLPDSLGHISDAVQGSRVLYSLVPDVAPADINSPIAPFASIKEIEYRYRAFNLTNTSVLNSSDTLNLSEPDVPSERASFNHQFGNLNDFSLMFSAEHLDDTEKYVELDDEYLQNGMEANLVLREGIPPFVRTFTDDGKFRGLDTVVPTESTYEGDGEGSMDLSASLNIVSWHEQDGLIEHSSVPNFREDQSILLYSDLHEFTQESGESVSLNSICDDAGALSFGLGIDEEYYPNRELRLNDYLDFVERLDVSVVSTGELRAINGSNIIKSVGLNWNHIPTGSQLSVSGYTYTILKVINSNTIKIHQAFSGTSGRYTYSVTREEVPEVKVLLNEVVRKVNLGFTGTYGFYSDSYINGVGSTGFQPWNQVVNFPDPDPDPYPRNLDNPFIYGATGPQLLDSEIEEEGGEADHLLSTDEADKMVKWRNWDQDITDIGLGLIQEPINNALDDLADDISMLFWDVASQDFVTQVFSGTVISVSETVGLVNATDYPLGLVKLVDENDLSGLNDAQYTLKNTVVRQVLPDNSVEIIAIEEFIRI